MHHRRHRHRQTMLQIGPYYRADAEPRLQGIGQLPWPLPGLASGTTWPSVLGWPQGLPGLPGVTLPPPGNVEVPGLPPLGIPTQLFQPYLQAALLLTPWAWMPQAGAWQELSNPEFNVALIDAGALDRIGLVTGPPGWLAAYFPAPLSSAAAASLFAGTPYDLFSAEAAYSQSDVASVPKIVFVYWGQLRPDWQSKNRNGVQAIKEAGGRPMVGVQLEYPATAARGKPSGTFGEAYRAQVPPPPVGRPNGMQPMPVDVPPVPGGQKPPPPPVKTAGAGTSLGAKVGAVALGLLFAGIGWKIVRSKS